MVETNAPKRVLIVEDEEGIREILELNLRCAGYQVSCSPDGLSAWQQYEQKHPHVVLLDLNLPQVSGFRLLELIRNESDVPILIITAYDFAEAEEVSRFRPNGFVKKPFDPEEVLAMIGTLIARSGQNEGRAEEPG